MLTLIIPSHRAINGPAEECALGATKFCGNHYSIYMAFEKRKEFCAAANQWIQPCMYCLIHLCYFMSVS